MRKITFFLSLLVSVWATAQVTQPQVSTDTEKHYYKFINSTNSAYCITTNGFGFKGSNEEASTLFTFEDAGEEGIYYIKSATYDGYVSADGVTSGGVIKWTTQKGDTEKWKLKVSGNNVTFISYETKDEETDAAQLGWNPYANPGGNIILYGSSPTANGATFWQMVEKTLPAVPEFTPVNVDDITSGWYQIKVVEGFNGNTLTAGKYLTNTPAYFSNNWWAFSLHAMNNISSTFVYVDKTESGIAIKNCKGKYATASGYISDTPVYPFQFTAGNGGNNHILIKAVAGNKTYQHFGWYDSGSNTLFIGVSSGSNNLTAKTFEFSKVDDYIATTYDVYDVEYKDFEPVHGAVGVIYNADDYSGVRLAYPGGKFFIRKDKTDGVLASDFSILSSRNVNFLYLDVDTEKKVVSVCQNLTATVEEMLRLSEAPNQVGFPANGMDEINAPLKTALAKAKETANIANLTELESAFTTWKTAGAQLSDIVMPKDGKAYYLRNVQQNLEKNYLLANNENGELVVKPYSKENKDLSAVFVCHNVSDDYYVFTNAAKGNYMVWRGLGGGYNNDKGYSESYVAAKCNFQVISQPSARPGTFRLVSKRSGNDDGSLVLTSTSGSFEGWRNSVCWTAAYSNAFVLEEVTDYDMNSVTLKAPQTDDSYKYASLYLPYSATIPEGVEAFTATREDAALALTAIEGTTLPKKTAVVLRQSAAESVAETPLLFIPATEAGTAVESNALQGTVDAAAQASADTYVLSGAFGEIGFYKYSAENLPAGKAYLVASDVPSDVQGVQSLRFVGNDVTGIGTATTTEASGAACYDLSGRRVTRPAAGIYVRNGKKVFVK